MFSSMGGLSYNGVLSNVVVFKEWSCRESADMCKRVHNRYTVVVTKAETIVGHLPQKKTILP